MRFRYTSMLILTGLLSASSCDDILPGAPPDDTLLDGPVDGLSDAQNRQFLLGDRAFNDEIFTVETGLGPIFVATSCGSCHAGDGKGHPFTTLTRFGQADPSGNQYLDQGGPQLQHRAIPGYEPETLPIGATFSRLTPPSNTGLGFLELVSDADILALADPDDNDGDGISGVPNWIDIPSYANPPANAITQNGKYIGRFGKKGAVFNLLQQTVAAYNQDIGITSDFEPRDVYSGQDIDPEVSTQTILDLVFYLKTLKAPIQRKKDDPEILQGKEIFIQIGCEACHKQTLVTANSNIDALSNKTFHPYTDMLVHDMGSALDDGYTEGGALSYEWRTPPLWGLGLAPQSQGGEYFLLHDGRAGSISEAITLHGGEAASSGENYSQLSAEQKELIMKFLESL